MIWWFASHFLTCLAKIKYRKTNLAKKTFWWEPEYSLEIKNSALTIENQRIIGMCFCFNFTPEASVKTQSNLLMSGIFQLFEARVLLWRIVRPLLIFYERIHSTSINIYLGRRVCSQKMRKNAQRQTNHALGRLKADISLSKYKCNKTICWTLPLAVLEVKRLQSHENPFATKDRAHVLHSSDRQRVSDV